MNLHGKAHNVCLPEKHKLLNQTGTKMSTESRKRSLDVTYGENLVKYYSKAPFIDRQIKRM